MKDIEYIITILQLKGLIEEAQTLRKLRDENNELKQKLENYKKGENYIFSRFLINDKDNEKHIPRID